MRRASRCGVGGSELGGVSTSERGLRNDGPTRRSSLIVRSSSRGRYRFGDRKWWWLVLRLFLSPGVRLARSLPDWGSSSSSSATARRPRLVQRLIPSRPRRTSTAGSSRCSRSDSRDLLRCSCENAGGSRKRPSPGRSRRRSSAEVRLRRRDSGSRAGRVDGGGRGSESCCWEGGLRGRRGRDRVLVAGCRLKREC